MREPRWKQTRQTKQPGSGARADDYESAEQQALDAAKNIRHRADALIARITSHQEHGSHLWPGLIEGVPSQSIHDLNRALGEMTALARLLKGTPRKVGG